MYYILYFVNFSCTWQVLCFVLCIDITLSIFITFAADSPDTKKSHHLAPDYLEKRQRLRRKSGGTLLTDILKPQRARKAQKRVSKGGGVWRYPADGHPQTTEGPQGTEEGE